MARVVFEEYPRTAVRGLGGAMRGSSGEGRGSRPGGGSGGTRGVGGAHTDCPERPSGVCPFVSSGMMQARAADQITRSQWSVTAVTQRPP